MSNQACCSHSRVIRNITDHPGGTKSEHWECPDCLTRFWPEGTDMHKLRRRHEFEVAAMQGFCANSRFDAAAQPEVFAEWAIKFAEAIMVAKEPKQP